MLEEIYNYGCLDYGKLIRKFYKQLNLNEINCLVLITILDVYQNQKSFKDIDIVNESGLSMEQVIDGISDLLNLDYIEIFLSLTDDGKQAEAYRITPFFQAFEKIINDNEMITPVESNAEVISQVIDKLEDKVKRSLTAAELDKVSSWFKDGKSSDEILTTIDSVTGVFRIASVEKKLYQVGSGVKENDKIKKAFAMIGKR